jgi:16S rRNA (cytosine967-C5)-methyltransferase
LGTIRRHPEIRWRRQEADLEPVAAQQLQILTAASEHVALGGTLVYAVCSPEPEEGEAVISAFLGQQSSFRQDATLVTAPPVEGEDAHQAFRLIRKES